MERGYVKLWRKSLNGGILGNQKLWTFWCWCLLKATHKQIKQMVGFQEVLLEPGQFIFGRKKAAKELKISERSIRTIILNLKKHEKLTIKTTNKFSVITIVNWELYQSENTKSTSKSTSNRPASDQQVTTNKNIRTKEHKKKNFLSDSIEVGLAEFFIELLDAREYPWSKKGKPNLQNWAIEFDKLLRIDGRKKEDIKELLAWVQKDDFWQDNILSPRTLRKQWGKLEMKMRKERIKNPPKEFPKTIKCNFCGEKNRAAHHYSSCLKCKEDFYEIRKDGTWRERFPDSDSKELKQLTGKLEEKFSMPQEAK